MSSPLWPREQNSPNKKMARNSQIKNFSNISNLKKPRSDEHMFVGDLLQELQSVLNEKAKLESENSSLRGEIDEFRSKNDVLSKAVHLNKSKFEKDLSRLEEQVKLSQALLFDRDKKGLEEQKKHMDEIKYLKSENEKLKLAIAKAERDGNERLKSLESEQKILQLDYENLKNQNEENLQKSSKYKSKLKNAISVINDLNSIVLQHTHKPHCINTEVQTEYMRVNATQESQSIQCYCASYPQETSKTEDMLLADIFFKPKSFCENELPLFTK